jgi:hypothetical protein
MIRTDMRQLRLNHAFAKPNAITRETGIRVITGYCDKALYPEVGKLADLVIIDQNPLANLQVLYGTGAIQVTPDNQVVRVGGVKYTVKNGIVYDAKKLLDDVKKIVSNSK